MLKVLYHFKVNSNGGKDNIERKHQFFLMFRGLIFLGNILFQLFPHKSYRLLNSE